jgi:hypothetical protein
MKLEVLIKIKKHYKQKTLLEALTNKIKKLLKILPPFYKEMLGTIEHFGTMIKIGGIRNQNVDYKSIYKNLLDYKARYENPEPGSTEWLILAEHKYGGLERQVKRRKISKLDPRKKEEIATGGMVGGDRMNEMEHNYAPLYSRYLKPFMDRQLRIVLVEVGILKGTGVAIWSELFAKGRIIGLDIDLTHITNNLGNLKKIGAFKNNNIELYEFDQFLDNKENIGKILKGEKVDIVIDDGVHLDYAVINTLSSFLPHLKDRFIYIIEDNKTVYKEIIKLYPNLDIVNYGEITVIKNKL